MIPKTTLFRRSPAFSWLALYPRSLSYRTNRLVLFLSNRYIRSHLQASCHSTHCRLLKIHTAEPDSWHSVSTRRPRALPAGTFQIYINWMSLHYYRLYTAENLFQRHFGLYVRSIDNALVRAPRVMHNSSEFTVQPPSQERLARKWALRKVRSRRTLFLT